MNFSFMSYSKIFQSFLNAGRMIMKCYFPVTSSPLAGFESGTTSAVS